MTCASPQRNGMDSFADIGRMTMPVSSGNKLVRKMKKKDSEKKPLSNFFIFSQMRKAEMKQNGTVEKLIAEFKARDPMDARSNLKVQSHISQELGKEWKALSDIQKGYFHVEDHVQSRLRAEGKLSDPDAIRQIIL